MYLPRELLLTDLLRYRLRVGVDCDSLCTQAWIHPSSHRILGWVSKSSLFEPIYSVWRLNQLCGFSQEHIIVQGNGVEIDDIVLKQLPKLINSKLINTVGQKIGIVVDIVVEIGTGKINNYLIARSNPNIPGTSRWYLNPSLVIGHSSDQIFTEIESLQTLPLIRSSVRQHFISKSYDWHLKMKHVNNKAMETLETLFNLSNSNLDQNDHFRSEQFSKKEIDALDFNEFKNSQDRTHKNQENLANHYDSTKSHSNVFSDEDFWI